MPKTLADMDLFSIVEAGKVIISDRGVYSQVDLFERGANLYAGYRKGFVRLLARNLTTVPTVKWDAIEGVAYREEYNGAKLAGAPVHLVAAE